MIDSPEDDLSQTDEAFLAIIDGALDDIKSLSIVPASEMVDVLLDLRSLYLLSLC